MMMVMAPLRRLVNVSSQLQQGIAAGASLFEVLDDRPRARTGWARARTRARGEVEFRDAGFTYPGAAEPALRQVSVAVGPGQTLAIVGKSGGGKSTLVGLVPRLYDVTSGAVLLDGIDVREFDLRDLRRQVAYVGQDVMLFNDSIRNNIAFGIEAAPAEADLRMRRAPRTSWSSRRNCRRASIPWWAIAATCCPEASASAWPSRGRYSRTRRC